jgi:hypothetical protein
MSLGDTLIEADRQVPHGQWGSWLHDNCELSERSAQAYMQLARNRAVIQAKTADSADLSIDAALRYVRKIAGKTEVAIAAPVEEPSPELLAQRAASAARIRGLLGDDHLNAPAGVDDDLAAAAKRAERTVIINGAPSPTATAVGSESPGECARLQAVVEEQGNALRQSDLKIIGLQTEIAGLQKELKKERLARSKVSIAEGRGENLTNNARAFIVADSPIKRHKALERLGDNLKKRTPHCIKFLDYGPEHVPAVTPPAATTDTASVGQDPAPTEAPKVDTIH